MAGLRAFSLIELVIVVVIMAIVAAIAVPRVSTAAESAAFRAQHAAFLNLERAVELYYIDHGTWPRNANQTQLSADLRPYLTSRDFARTPPIGGQWDWNGPGSTISRWGFNMAVRESPAPTAKWLAFDRLIDDGNLSTGLYRRDGNYLVRPVAPP